MRLMTTAGFWNEVFIMGAKNKMDPRRQFSKWLARSSAWFLIFYLIALLVLIYLRPDTAVACVYLAIIVSVIRIFDAGFYTKNSLTEKMLLTILDKSKLSISLKSGTNTNDESSEDDESTEEEGESNG